MTDETADRRVGQRRIEERSDCDIEARVELSDRLAIACRIKDLSTFGFKIQIVEAIHLPDEFDLLIPVVEGIFNGIELEWRGGMPVWSAEYSSLRTLNDRPVQLRLKTPRCS